MSENPSDVARLRLQIEMATEASRRVLYDMRATARHDIITAQMHRGGDYLLMLIAQGRHQEVQALMETDWWEQDGSSAPGPDEA